jgi:hypothetical protein
MQLTSRRCTSTTDGGKVTLPVPADMCRHGVGIRFAMNINSIHMKIQTSKNFKDYRVKEMIIHERCKKSGKTK